MTKISFQGLNNVKNPMMLNADYRKILGQQKIWCEIDNDKGTIMFSVYPSEDVPAYYQTITIKMIMDEFVFNTCEETEQRAYKYHNIHDEILQAIENDKNLEY